MFRRIGPLSASLGLVLGVAVLACDDSSGGAAYRSPRGKKAGPGGAMAVAEARKRAEGRTDPAAASEETDVSAPELPDLTESMFIASERHRDPFAPYLEVLVKKETLTERPIQRDVKLKEYDISALKLIGIITNIGDPRAMVTTPDNTGFVLRRGDYVGRADFVRQKNGDAVQVNWRVARIHGAGKEEERGIYLVRDDPTSVRGESVTRFVPLHPID